MMKTLADTGSDEFRANAKAHAALLTAMLGDMVDRGQVIAKINDSEEAA